MAFIASGKTVRVWLDVLYVFGVFLPGLLNYVPLVVREYNHFWRQNVVLTAWYQVIVATILNIGGLVNVLVMDDCLDEYHSGDTEVECDDVEITIVVFIVTVFIIQISWMIYLAYKASQFLKEYEKEHAEEISSK